MWTRPNPLTLLTRATALLDRVRDIERTATHPVTKGQIAALNMQARNIRTWLSEATLPGALDTETMLNIEQRLTAEAQRLDEIEDLLRAHGADASPQPAHARHAAGVPG